MRGSITTLLLLAVLAPAPAPARASAAPEEGAGPRLEISVEPEHVRLGAPLRYRLRFLAAPGHEFYFPPAPELDPFRLVAPAASGVPEAPAPSAIETVHKVEDGLEVTEVTLHLRAYRLGLRKIPAIDVPYLAPDGSTGVLRLPEQRVRVLSRLGTEAEPALATPGSPLPVTTRNWALIGVLIALGALALSALGAWLISWWRRRRPALAPPPPPPRPAHEVALEKLAAIEAAGLLAQGEKMAFYVRVSEATREYFGGRYGFDGLSMTSLELLRALRGCDLSTVPESKVRDFLDECDLVKFAGFSPTDEEAAWLLATAYELVRGTMPSPGPALGGEGGAP